MKPENLSDAIGMIDDEIVTSAEKIRTKKDKKIWLRWVAAAVCACFVLTGAAVYVFKPAKIYAVSEAKYPKMVQYPEKQALIGNTLQLDVSDDFKKWSDSLEAQWAQKPADSEKLDGFFAASTQQFLSDLKGENRVYSPLNVYMALSMLAELTDGDSRSQILSLIGASSIEQLRQQAAGIWNSTYRKDGAAESVLANSLWMDDKIRYNKKTLNTLAEKYYASSFKCDLSSNSCAKAIDSWTNKQTNGLVKHGDARLDPRTVMALISTVYFQAKWENEFDKSQTVKDKFNAPQGYVECDFMKKRMRSDYYWGEKFSAISLEFSKSHATMRLILPDTGVSVDDLIADSKTMEMLLSEEKLKDKTELMVNLSMPRFDISSDIDLSEGLKKLGVRDVFNDKKSDFSPLTDETKVYLSKVRHSARVQVDEEGCKAAAFTELMMNGGTKPPDDEIDFVLNRPFIMVISSECGEPLFVGVVNRPK